jgi:cell division protein ZapE
MDVQEFYDHALAQRGFFADRAQQQAVAQLQTIYRQWLAYQAQRKNFLVRLYSHLLKKPKSPRGLYMWGGVGRGKSFLMDSFYSVAPIAEKTRVHFHAFMRNVHQELDALKMVADPLDTVASNIAKKYKLICFDEFHVTEIADAIILYNLCSALFRRDVSFIVTSNYAPDDLYPDGLHRDRILPAIALLKDKLQIMNVDGGTDYRKAALTQATRYLSSNEAATEAALQAAFSRIAEVADENPQIEVNERSVNARRRAGGVIWFDFAALCGGPRSQNDYLEIAQRFHTLILSDVPRLTASMQAEVRRFIWLIDVLYDCKTKLLLSSDIPVKDWQDGQQQNSADEKYNAQAHGNSLPPDFQRTVSRLIEMQSDQYMEAARIYPGKTDW